MDKALDFLKNHVDVAFATSEGNRPHIRIFQIMKMEGTTLFFATSFKKEVYKQLKENPHIELIASEGNLFVKCSGQADFDVETETQKWIFNNNPVLPRLYPSYDQMAYFKMEIEMMDYYDLTPTPPLLEHYNLTQNTVNPV